MRVGISAPLDGARNPVANTDEVTVRPGRSISVQVLANDSDPDGSPLIVTDGRRRTPTTPPRSSRTTRSSRSRRPTTPGDYSVIYTIQNESGGTSQAFVYVKVDADAPLGYPVAQDTVLAVSDVLDQDTVDVAVLDNVFFPDGESSELGVALVQGYSSGAQVLAEQAHPGDDRRQEPDHPVLGLAPRRRQHPLVRVHLGARLRRRAARSSTAPRPP